MVLLGCFVFRVSLENLLRAAAENTAFVIGVMEFGAGRADTAVYEQKEFCGNQHTETGGQQIDPRACQYRPRNAEPKVRAGFMLIRRAEFRA
jgi:hypothetical protein